MAKNVRFIQTTKAKYLARETYDNLALYFCIDTNELFKGEHLYTDGIRVVKTATDLPGFANVAADGIIYYVAETKNGYVLSPDRTEWLQIIYAPTTDVYAVPESEIYNTVTTVGAVKDVESKIYEHIEEVVSELKPLGAGDGIKIIDGKIYVGLSDISNGLTLTNGELSLALATKDTAGAMSAADKQVVNAIPYTYEARKFDISNVPSGTLVDYRDHEIRVMCPVGTEFKKQAVGENGNANMYYMSFKAYAPDGAVSFKEGDRGVIVDEMFDFNGSASGIDEFGRKYSVCWLALAMYDSSTDQWSYFGKNSTTKKYIGWDYVVEWYDANGVRIGFDTVRINLSNEDCHFIMKPFYGTTTEEMTEEKVEDIVEEKIADATEDAKAYTDARVEEVYTITEF